MNQKMSDSKGCPAMLVDVNEAFRQECLDMKNWALGMRALGR
jgi:hypothetical protein